jgi:ubiquinone/menaquinone biosynthesis C-methylase UbiE
MMERIQGWLGRARRRREAPVARLVEELRDAYSDSAYFAQAEGAMERAWQEQIEPRLAGFDLEVCVELAPGHGRNSARLAERAREIWLIDVNESCIEACRARFGERQGDCRFHYLVNDGRGLGGVPDGVASFVYSWDSVVHFDREIVRGYVPEFARVMRPGAGGLVHHSNYGNVAADSDWRSHPHWRSNMTAELFRAYCEEAGLEVIRQDLLEWGRKAGAPVADIDCVSLFRKPA